MDRIMEIKVNNLYDAGHSLRAISKKLRISHENARSAIPKDRIRHARVTEEMKERIRSEFNRNPSYQEVADDLGLESRQQVYRVVRGEGMTLPSRPRIERSRV